jgi:hypothetical protein
MDFIYHHEGIWTKDRQHRSVGQVGVDNPFTLTIRPIAAKPSGWRMFDNKSGVFQRRVFFWKKFDFREPD